jgi:dienelactone hydrolase
MKSRYLFAIAAFTTIASIWNHANAQVAAGGGGEIRPDQYFSKSEQFNGPLFTMPGSKLTLEQKKRRNAIWRREIRKQLFVPDRLPALSVKIRSQFSPMPGVIAQRITYSTADGMIVPAIAYSPDPKILQWKGKLPGVVIVNGHGGDKFSWYAFYSGLLFARAGAVVVTYDPIGEGERNERRASRENPSPHDKAVDSAHWGQRLAGLMQADLMQAVSYLASRPDVNAGRIAVAGYSMGAFISGIAGAIDPRIHAVLLSGGGTYDGPYEYFDTGKLPCQSPPYRSLAVLGDRGAVLYALNAARGPMLVMNGDADTVMRMSDHPPAWFEDIHDRTVSIVGSDTRIFTTVLYPNISHRTSWVNLDGVLWLNHQIHFKLWTDADIKQAGTTHISTWTSANNVDISKNYIREDREGGLDAVGKGFSGIARQDLMVLDDLQWQRERDTLTYEAWAGKMIKIESSVKRK